MLVRLLGKLFVNPINIPLRRFAFATRRCPPSKGEVGLAKAIGAGVVFSDIPLRRSDGGPWERASRGSWTAP